MRDRYEEKARETCGRIHAPHSSAGDCYSCGIIAQAIRSVAAETWEEAAREVPSNWVDPILSGPSAVKTSNCQETVDLLNAVRNRLNEKARAIRAEGRE